MSGRNCGNIEKRAPDRGVSSISAEDVSPQSAAGDHRSPDLRLSSHVSLSSSLSFTSTTPRQRLACGLFATMCGIFFSLSASGAVLPNEETCCLLRKRGPDNYHVHNVEQKIANTRSSNEEPIAVQLTFVSTVLSMRGGCLVPQPLVDLTTQSVLCYNGDAWKISGEPIQGNDAELIFKLLLQAVNHHSKTTSSADSGTTAVQGVLDVISSISGPFAFVFYDAINSKLFFTRDSLGRRSLLQGVDESGAFKLCSLCDGTSSTHFSEVETDGVYMIDFEHAIFQDNWIATRSAGAPLFDASCIQTLSWEHNTSDLPLRPVCTSSSS